MRRLLGLLALLAVLAAGCGETTEVRERDIVVRGDGAAEVPPPAEAGGPRRGLRVADARIAVVTHGQASDPFWAVVKKGLDDAADQTGSAVSYRAPDTYDLRRMRRLIDEAVSDRPDGLIVSLPDARALAPQLRRARDAGVPVVTINSGSEAFRRLGALAHVGQPEWRAGFEAGERMARAGVRRALCVNQEVGNAGLDLRCRAFGAAMRRAGGTSRVLAVRLQDPQRAQRRVSTAVSSGNVDGVITLGPGGAAPALAALRGGGLRDRIRLATFDLSPEVLAGIRGGRILFAVDQQPYLQGYLPVLLLTERARFGLFPAPGELIPTGPQFVTRDNADQALELSRRGIR